MRRATRMLAAAVFVACGPHIAVDEGMTSIGPGCTQMQDGAVVGQAMPPVRIADVCAGLDDDETVGCCIESICDPSFSTVVDCMVGIFGDECPNLVPCG